jgi:L-phenylalanine/L-methionine N-acetyltransferase
MTRANPARPSSPDRLRIRQAEPDDHDGVRSTMVGPEGVRGTLQLPMPTHAMWRERMAAFDKGAVMLVAEVPGDIQPGGAAPTYEIVGHASLHPVGSSLRRRHAMGLGMSVRDEWQGHGIGSALLGALIERADRWMHVLRIELTVFVDNEAAIALYRRQGFVVEGTYRAYALRDGAFVDALAMARLHPHPPQLPVP